MKSAEQLYLPSREEWRRWLEQNHRIRREVWLIYYKTHTGKPSIPYDDSVEEAICFGWIDGIIKKLDDEKFTRKFMPRRKNSNWSESNKKRATFYVVVNYFSCCRKRLLRHVDMLPVVL